MTLTEALNLLLAPVVLAGAIGCSGFEARVGEPLPVWSSGYLDIHAINTGRGECTLVIMPDGTSLVVDAGEFSRESYKYRNVKQKPDSLARPYLTYARYIKHFAPEKDSIGYFLLTHFHMDHMGQVEEEYERSDDGAYVLCGLTALYEELPFRTVIDRAYPDYDLFMANGTGLETLDNYRKFLNAKVLRKERFRIGTDCQIVPERAVPGFRIRNICANGQVEGIRLGAETAWIEAKHKGMEVRENNASCGILISYGDFDYFTAGDIDSKNEMESRCSHIIGRKVEAVKAGHHLSPKTMGEDMIKILNPDVIVTQSFYIRDIQPDKDIIRRISESSAARMYFTNIDPSLVEADPEAYSSCAAIGGHVVIRVSPEGRYYVFVLDDTDENYIIRQIDGPYHCE